MIIKHGRWYSDFYTSQGRRVRKPLGLPASAPKREAERAEALLMAQMEAAPQMGQALAAKGPSMSLKDAFKQAMQEREEWRTSKSPRTLHSTLDALLHHFGDHATVDALDVESVRRYKATLLAQGLAATTVNTRLSMINVLVRTADPEAARLNVARARVVQGRRRAYTEDEARSIVREAYNVSRLYGQAVEFAIETGLRRSEITRVEIRDVVYPAEGRPRLMVWEAKANNPSPVPLTAAAARIINERVIEAGAAPTARLFPIDPDTLTKTFKRVTGALGLAADPSAVFHALRHTTATRILERTGDIRAAQGFLRHKSLQTTLGYAHLSGRALDRVAGALEGAQSEYNAPPVTEGDTGSSPTVNPQVPGSSPGRGAK